MELETFLVEISVCESDVLQHNFTLLIQIARTKLHKAKDRSLCFNCR